MTNIQLGRYTTKPVCDSFECSMAELCSSPEGRRKVALGIAVAAEANDPTLLDQAFIDGSVNPKGDRASHCVHLARRIAQCVPELGESSVIDGERLLEWSVETGFSTEASINQPRD